MCAVIKTSKLQKDCPVIDQDGGNTNSFSEYMHTNKNIGTLKERIAKKIDIAPTEFILWRRGVQLDENQTPKDYDLGSGARIHVRRITPQITVQETEAMASDHEESDEMEWSDAGDTISLKLREGSMGNEYDIPLTITPRQILRKYAENQNDEIYNRIYALYNEEYELPMDDTLGDLVQKRFIKDGDTLRIAITTSPTV